MENIKEKYVKELRLKATFAEKLMISKLKYNKIKFVFQHCIDYEKSYIICDFYIPKYNVIIELDGMYHDEILQTLKDIKRDKFLSESGFNVIRLFNNEVDSFDTVKIKSYPIAERKEKPKPQIKQTSYSLAQKVEDKKKLSRQAFKAKYKNNV